ncbi:Cytochrome P450 85A1 [Camellia lanceoleosa]|uniref:Cytochrome P450 85A1 n=1 Tax=Camellia lanceoleosa TaxID=1840588 RepID=A0ACC0IQ05_9ERIC|nr:Cytochrome P450 85A1 [Camellia lanceoleosa]
MIAILYSGYETVSTTSMMAVKYLHDHSNVLQELRVKRAFGDKRKESAEDPINWNDFKSMNFTDNIELAEEELLTRREEGNEASVDDSLREISIVEESIDCIGISNEVDKCKIAESLGKVIGDGTRAAESMMKEKEGLQQGCNDETIIVGGQTPTSGFVRSLSGTAGARSANSNMVKPRINKGKRKVGARNPTLVGGFSGFTRRLGQLGAGFCKNNSKGVVGRAAAAAVLKSAAGKSIPSYSEDKLHEAQLTLLLGNSLGIDCMGQDEEVLQKIVQMEELDEERMGIRADGAV